MYFLFESVLKIMNEVTSLNFSTKGEKVEDSDFVKIFLRMKPNWKKPSEIKPPFRMAIIKKIV